MRPGAGRRLAELLELEALVEVALQAGANDSHLIDYANQIEDSWLEGVGTVGVTAVPRAGRAGDAGAGAPRRAERLGREVEEVTTANEKITFALPRELRKDLKENPDAPKGVR
ncbi:hypothetical protein GCM10020366_10330 [Saccharopolyspora gregorii]|uniref:Nucleoid-associated protein n=1 Tax=Saccharopolyspora gregorii TaxID=33914 RepID=A0ABP6RJ95_9PSEU